MWKRFKFTIDVKVQSELEGNPPSGGHSTWNEHWQSMVNGLNNGSQETPKDMWITSSGVESKPARLRSEFNNENLDQTSKANDETSSTGTDYINRSAPDVSSFIGPLGLPVFDT